MKKIAFLALALTLVGGTADAQRARTNQAAGTVSTQREDPADSLYRLGRLAMNENDYRRASGLFKQVVDKYPKSAKAGEALFWGAWSLHKLGVERRSKTDLEDALVAIERQQKEYPSSVVAGDTRVLRNQIRSAQASLGDASAAGEISSSSKGLAQARGCTGNKADEEMRIAALDGLINMNPEDAIPILKEVLNQRDPCRVELRKKAVWLISTKGRGPDVAQTLLNVARTDPDMDVRGDAIHWLATSRSDIAVPALDSILFSGGDDEIRKKAVFALSQAARSNERARQSVRRAAEDEKLSEDVRADAIFWLGNAHLVDVEYFKTLFRKTSRGELREKILFAAQQTPGNDVTAWLQELARDRTVDVDTRKNAIFNLGQRRSVNLDLLSTIYDQSKGEDEIQDQVLFVYSMRREPAAADKLIAIAKEDPNVDRRKQALFWLGQKNDPRIQSLLREIILGTTPSTKKP